MANSLKLYISQETQRLLASSGAFNSAPAPVFYSGNRVQCELHLMDGVGVARTPFEVPFPAGAAIKLAIGNVATAPTAGQWRLSVSSTETSDLAFNASASAVQTALNAVAAVSSAGGVTVSALGDGYSITWNTVGTKPAIVAGTDTLVPSSYQSIFILQAGSATEREIVFVELRQSPVALADSFSAMPASVASVTTVSAWNGSNKVIRVGVSPDPKGGSYVLTLGTSNAVINVGATVADVRSALIAAGYDDFGAVTQTGTFQHDIVLTANSTATVDGSGLINSIGMIGELDLGTSEMLAYIGSEATAPATLEITITTGTEERTICQVACTVANGVISAGAVSPVVVGTILTESVANARYVRRDAAQSPTGADLDVIWPNLGVTADGSDVAAALSAANAPASGNAFATMADVGPSFDQSLNTTDNVLFNSVESQTFSAFAAANEYADVTPSGLAITSPTNTLSITASGITFSDSTVQTSAFIPANYLTVTAASSTYQTIAGMSSYLTTASASSTYQTIAGMSSYLTTASASSTYALLSSFDQALLTTSDPVFNSVQVTAGILFGGVNNLADSYQTAGTVLHSGGGGHIDALDYPDEVILNINGVLYAMPARAI